MPHTTRRRPNPTLKHQHLTTSDGWTHVFRGTSSQKRASRPPPTTTLSPTEIANGFTLAKVQETDTKYTRQWRESEWCAELVGVMRREVLAGIVEEGNSLTGRRVENCVVLGLGSLSGGDGREHSWRQLAALQTILEELRKYLPWSAIAIPRRLTEAILGSHHAITDVVFQDPRFNRLDEEFLSSLSFTTVHDPAAFSSIGPATFVYIPHGELEVTALALEGKEPAMYVGNDLDMWIENPTVDKAKKEMVRKWRDESVSVGMPRAESSGWCNNTKIYWKRQDADEGVGQ